MAHGQLRVAIIGGGYAGMAAAATLSLANIRTVTFEAGKEPGGRARRIHARDTTLDNGQHILIGAYRELLGLMQTVGAPADYYVRQPLHLRLHPAFTMRAPRLPAPFDLAWALVAAEGLTWRDRWAAVRFMRRLPHADIPADMTVAQLYAVFGQTDNLVSRLWTPLCIAALNTAPQIASAQVFARVIRDALLGPQGSSDLLLPAVDLSELFPLPAARWLANRGSEVRLGTRVTAMARHDTQFDVTFEHEQQRSQDRFDAIICAVGPHQLEGLAAALGDASMHAALTPPRATRFEPIYTVYLQYPGSVSLEPAMLGQEHGMAQWYFDRGRLCNQPGLIAAVISASGPHQDMDHAAIARQAHAELQGIKPGLQEPLWSKVIAEKFATMSCEPGLIRPSARTPIPRLFLAGDYTAGDYPATLEGAVRSGQAAARLLLENLSS